MPSGPSRVGRTVASTLEYLRWRRAGKPFTHGAPGYDSWMQTYDPLTIEPVDVGLVSIICPVHDPDPAHLERAIRSALDQTYQPLEVVLVDDASRLEDTLCVLDRYRDHPNVIVATHETNRGIAESLNTGTDAASGNILIFLDHDDELAPDAVTWLSHAFQDARVVYTDEDQLSPEGDRVQPFLKPAWSPILLLGMNYVNHLTAIDRELLIDLGGFDSQLSGAQDHDLMLRISEQDIPVAHIPKVLYHWRQSSESVARDVGAKPWALQAARRCVGASLARRGIEASVEDAPDAGPYRFAIRFADTHASTHVVLAAETFSAAELNNAVAAVAADCVVFVPGSSPPPDATIRQLAGWLSIGSVAASGPMIVDDHERISEAGWIIARGTAYPYGAGRSPVEAPFFEVAREVSALGGSYLGVRRDDFLAVGGFTDGQSFTHGGVDLSMRIAAATNRTCVVDSTIRLPATTTNASESLRLDASIASSEADVYVSPHMGVDGVSISDVPTDPAALLGRLQHRFSPTPSTA